MGGYAAAHGFDYTTAGKRRRYSRIAGGAVSHGGKDSFEVGHANETDHFLGSTEMFNCGDCQIPQCGPLALGPNDPLTFIHPALGERHERLAGQMPDRLAAVGAAHNNEADVRVGNHIGDQTLDTQIFRVQCPDDRYFGKPHTGDGLRKRLVVESDKRQRVHGSAKTV